MATIPSSNRHLSLAKVSATPSAALIPTKLHPPRIRPGLVLRSQLTERLHQGLWRKLTLISTAAGSGKTTLVAQWMNETGAPVAWLSLDEADNEVQRFLTYLIAALATIKPGLEKGTRHLLQSAGTLEPEPLLTNLVIAPLATESKRMVLVLDDYHLIDDGEIHDIVVWLLDHLPPSLHLILITRQDPPLPLARLRVRDELSEFRADDLRFSETEAAEFYNHIMDLGLTPQDIAALEARTEGWAAAIQLSALSLRDQRDKHAFIEALQGDQRPFADYLVQEVIEHQPPEVKDFLLKTSVLRRLCGPLCSALLARDDGQAMLERLERANLFIVPLDNRSEWYRYHHLFAELLRRRREQVLPGAAAGLHRRASAWYAEQGLAHEAVDHARRSADQTWLATLVERWGESLLRRSELGTLRQWLKPISLRQLRYRPRLALLDAWCAVIGVDLRRYEIAVGRAEAALSACNDLPDQERTRLHAHITAIRSFAASRQGDPQRGIELAREALVELPQSEMLARSILALSAANSLVRLEKYDPALGFLEEAQAAGHRSGNFYGAVTAMRTKAWIQLIKGRLRDAEGICHSALALVEREGFARLPMACHARLEMARVNFERYQLHEALGELNQCLDTSVLGADLSFLVPAYALLARIRLARQDHDGAHVAIGKAAALQAQAHWDDNGGVELQAVRALLALAEDDLSGARRWLGDYDLTRLTTSATQHPVNLVRCRMAILQGHDAGIPSLERQLAHADRENRLGHSLDWRVLGVVALAATGQLEQAALRLERTANRARLEGALRPFAEDWNTLGPLLARLRDERARGYLSRLAPVRAPSPRPAPTAANAAMPEPLSDRELDVLRLAARGHSNQAIADQLFVALGTVKTHMHNILAKFEVRNRTEAVHRARTLGLIGND